MKLVTYYLDPGEAAAAKDRLCQAGIKADVISVDPHVIQPSKSGAERFGLFVEFENQFKDAILLLENPDHVPQRNTSKATSSKHKSNVVGAFLKRLKNSMK